MADYRAQRLARMLADHKLFTTHSDSMTKTNIAAPSELVKQWTEPSGYKVTPSWLNEVIQKAIQYGADQELEACCEWLIGWDTCEGERLASLLHEGRRPKPPSLKEQALLAIDTAVADDRLSADVAAVVRRALEALHE
jgi:hypothetical protein